MVRSGSGSACITVPNHRVQIEQNRTLQLAKVSGWTLHLQVRLSCGDSKPERDLGGDYGKQSYLALWWRRGQPLIAPHSIYEGEGAVMEMCSAELWLDELFRSRPLGETKTLKATPDFL